MSTTIIDLAGLDGGHVNLTPAQLDGLDAQLTGRLVRAGDDGWDDALLIWNAMAATTPALIVQPASTHDVAAAVGFARDHRLLLSVKGGGHNIAGTAIAEGGLTLDLSRMRDLRVDPAGKLAHVGPGCLLKDVDQATLRHGLATPLGFISEVGVAGLTLGGGLGYLTRRFGWTVDNLEEVEIVTADGQIRTASRGEHRAVLGDPGCRRQPRCGHPVQLPLAPRRPDRLRRVDRLAVRAGRGDPAGLPDHHHPGAPRADGVADAAAGTGGAVHAPGMARPAAVRHGRLLQR